jgi:hypothetical protein
MRIRIKIFILSHDKQSIKNSETLSRAQTALLLIPKKSIAIHCGLLQGQIQDNGHILPFYLRNINKQTCILPDENDSQI